MFSGNLEYLISSLPQLQFKNVIEDKQRVHSIFQTYGLVEGDVDMVTILNDEASKYLSSKKSIEFNNISLKTIQNAEFKKHNDNVLAGFSNYISDLKEKIKVLRLSRKQEILKPINQSEELQLKQGNPLEEELQLLEMQWNQIETLSINHFSDFSALVAYKLKLLLLQRLWSFNETEGFNRYLQFIKPTDNGR